MDMIIYSETEFRSGLWYEKAMEGIRKNTSKKGIGIKETDENTFTCLQADEIFSEGKRLLTVIGASDRHMERLIPLCRKNGISTLFVNYEPRRPSHDSSQVIMDYSDTMERIFCYLRAYGRTRTALLGVNPDSASDRRKADFMISHGKKDHIFYNDTGIAECVAKFLEKREEYDSIIFTNDVFMLAASSKLREAGVRVPEDLWVVSFSDTMLAPIFESPLSPGISTFAINYEELGRQCTELWHYLTKNPANISATIRVRAEFFPNASTGNNPLPEITPESVSGANGNFDFYSDHTVNEVTRLESCLMKCDDTDFQMLDLLIRNENRIGIALKLFISEGTLYYRLRRLCRLAGCGTIQELIDLTRKYLG